MHQTYPTADFKKRLRAKKISVVKVHPYTGEEKSKSEAGMGEEKKNEVEIGGAPDGLVEHFKLRGARIFDPIEVKRGQARGEGGERKKRGSARLFAAMRCAFDNAPFIKVGGVGEAV